MDSTSLWQRVNGEAQIAPLSLKLFRVVESQEQVATTLITESQEEQAILEQLIEQTKPVQSKDLASRHYLIKTPFRYPPLNYGSRFGSIWEPSLFYGSQTVDCALAEVAYYRFRFLSDMENSEALTRHNIQSYHSSFYVNTQSDQSVQLNNPPFSKYHQDLISVNSYAATQKLGQAMRDAGVTLFSYASARCEGGVNGAAYHHSVIKSPKPNAMQTWQCITQEQRIVFHHSIEKTAFEFTQGQFLVDGRFPVIR